MDKDRENDPLNPDSEQTLFEKLRMDDSDYEFLQYIRRHVKYIIKDEQRDTNTNTDR
jgi:hypothetical protein